MLSFVPIHMRGIFLAILAIAICIVLFHPYRKPVRTPAEEGTDAGQEIRRGGNEATSPGPSFSLSTVGILLQYRNGLPQILPGAADALCSISAVADVYLITQLPEDCDELEASTRDAMAHAGIFAANRCAKHPQHIYALRLRG